jgi:hypothetical protein
MSKTRTESPKRGSKSLPVRVKFKLGGRKSKKSALDLSNDALLKAYAEPSRKRDRSKVLQVIQKRKLELPVAVDE